MSLVAYGDSDDGSSDSEAEETTPIQPKPAPQTTLKDIERKEKSNSDVITKAPPLAEGRSKLSSLLPKPQNSSETTVVYSEPEKKLFDKVLQKDDNDDEIVEVEEEYVPLSELKKKNNKASVEKTEEQRSVGSLFSRMPSPWSVGVGISLRKKRGASDDVQSGIVSKKGKQPVRIAAPTLVDADSDDEMDDKQLKKVTKQSKTGSGLSSLLPKPKHSITQVTSNPNKPSAKLSSRPLIPHTLTKKPTETKPKKKKDNDNTTGDEDDDNQPVSFFTFADKKDTEVSQTKDSTSSASTSTSISTAPSSFTSTIKVSSKPEVAEVKVQETTYESEASSYSNKPSTSEYVGASYASSGYYNSTGGQSGSYGYSVDNTQHTGSYGGDGTTTTYYQSQDASQYYDHGSYDQGSYTTYYNTQPSYSQEATETQSQDLDIEKLQRLQGKKNRKEEINIIDINAADQTADTKVQLTNLTAEQFAHKTSKKQGNMPSSTQRRKHQITYLAFQAKEREFELQQQWSSNRQTKRQTQAKYGF